MKESAISPKGLGSFYYSVAFRNQDLGVCMVVATGVLLPLGFLNRTRKEARECIHTYICIHMSISICLFIDRYHIDISHFNPTPWVVVFFKHHGIYFSLFSFIFVVSF